MFRISLVPSWSLSVLGHPAGKVHLSNSLCVSPLSGNVSRSLPLSLNLLATLCKTLRQEICECIRWWNPHFQWLDLHLSRLVHEHCLILRISKFQLSSMGRLEGCHSRLSTVQCCRMCFGVRCRKFGIFINSALAYFFGGIPSFSSPLKLQGAFYRHKQQVLNSSTFLE